MIEAGKRMVQCSSRALSLTVLLMPTPTAQAASDIAGHVCREEAGDSIGIRFHHLPHVQFPTDHTGIEEFISRVVQLHVPHIGAAISGLPCPVATLVVDIFCTPALDASRELAVPAYVYFTSSAAMLALLLNSLTLHEEVQVEFEEMEGAVDVPGLSPVPPSFLLDTMLDRETPRSPTYTWFVYTGRRYMEADGIVNTAAELESGVLAAIADGRCTRSVHATTVYPIGPAMSISPPAAEPHECVRWLDSPPASVLFLCFGSKGMLSASQVHKIAHGLERSGHRFLWVLRGLPEDTSHGARDPTDANPAEALPKGFLEKTKEKGMVWRKRAPQKELLAHASVRGFVTHCRWNSILERADAAVAAQRRAAFQRLRVDSRHGRGRAARGGQKAGELRRGRGAGTGGWVPDGRWRGGKKGEGEGHGDEDRVQEGRAAERVFLRFVAEALRGAPQRLRCYRRSDALSFVGCPNTWTSSAQKH